MHSILSEPLVGYLKAKKENFAGNLLAEKLRNDYPKAIESIILDKARYKVVGSPGKGQWTDCPWIAILDLLIAPTPQSGYYPVFLFKADMTGVYLSLNQGVTEVQDEYRQDSKSVLEIRAKDYRAKLVFGAELDIKIRLNSHTKNASLYEAGNIVAKYYALNNLPTEEQLKADILLFIRLYEELTFNDTRIHDEPAISATEKKQYRLHFRIERNTQIAAKVKKLKGYKCEACLFSFKDKYGELGASFIEAHHLTPISKLGIGKFQLNLSTDFAVLCSNCHSMIHKLEDPSDLNYLKQIIQPEMKLKLHKPA